MVAAGSTRSWRLIAASEVRVAGPWSGSSPSMVLSQTVSTDSSSTGSSGSTSPRHSRLAGSASTGPTPSCSPVPHIARS